MPIGAYATQMVPQEEFGGTNGFIPRDAYEILGLYIVLVPTADNETWVGSGGMFWCANGEDNDNHMVPMNVTWSLLNGTIFSYDTLPHFVHNGNILVAGDIYAVMLTPTAPSEAIRLLGTVVRYKVGYPIQGGLGMIRHQFYPCQEWEV